MSHPDLIYTSAHLLISFRVSLSLCRLTNTERRGKDGRSGGKVEGPGKSELCAASFPGQFVLEASSPACAWKMDSVGLRNHGDFN